LSILNFTFDSENYLNLFLIVSFYHPPLPLYPPLPLHPPLPLRRRGGEGTFLFGLFKRNTEEENKIGL
jgi:hypothetical protein